MSHYSKLIYKGNVSFGAIYLIDSMCWEISRARRWRLDHPNLPDDEKVILSNLRSITSSTYKSDEVDMINEKVRIQRNDSSQQVQAYRIKIKEITDMIKLALSPIKGHNYDLSHEAYHAINSTIGEHFDNIYLHAPSAEYGTLCGFFDKRKMEVTILIFNFGNTIDSNLSKNDLPKEIQAEIDVIISNHISRNYFVGTRDFTRENAITLLAIQEGISSRLKYDKSRGHGLIDFIENCFALSDETKISIISGKTAIKIDKKYKVSNKSVFGRMRKIIALNAANDIFEKPDSTYVKNLNVFFPGVIIETRIPLAV